MILPIITEPDERLLRKSEPVAKVTDEHFEFARSMVETMIDAHGIGLAAPQVGRLERLVVIEIAGFAYYLLVNPVVTKICGDKKPMDEGCLSVPGRSITVIRRESISFNSQSWVLTRSGWVSASMLPEIHDLPARCILHEVDHLDGILIGSGKETG